VTRPDRNEHRRRERPPLDSAALDRLALHYVGRYATTRAKLAGYLHRKIDERGWAGEGAAPVDAVVARLAGFGYVDDRLFAESRVAALARRGFGARRQADALRASGIEPDETAAVLAERSEVSENADHQAALAYARRRRIGPFAELLPDSDARRRALAAMIRAGHDFRIARQYVEAAPGEFPEP
jgi:regulatory protein